MNSNNHLPSLEDGNASASSTNNKEVKKHKRKKKPDTEPYRVMRVLEKLLRRLHAKLIGEHLPKVPKASFSDDKVTNAMIQRVFKLDWWLSFETPNSKDCPYFLSLKILPLPQVASYPIQATISKGSLEDLRCQMFNNGESKHYSTQIRNILRTIDRLVNTSIHWEHLGTRVEAMVIVEDGLMAKLDIKNSVKNGQMFQLQMVVDPLNINSLKELQKNIETQGENMVPITTTQHLYDTGEEKENLA
jgi:hypothetical protein